jgi:hypothetical protein
MVSPEGGRPRPRVPATTRGHGRGRSRFTAAKGSFRLAGSADLALLLPVCNDDQKLPESGSYSP